MKILRIMENWGFLIKSEFLKWNFEIILKIILKFKIESLKNIFKNWIFLSSKISFSSFSPKNPKQSHITPKILITHYQHIHPRDKLSLYCLQKVYYCYHQHFKLFLSRFPLRMFTKQWILVEEFPQRGCCKA